LDMFFVQLRIAIKSEGFKDCTLSAPPESLTTTASSNLQVFNDSQQRGYCTHVLSTGCFNACL